MATFREDDVMDGRVSSKAARLQQIVSEASGGQKKKPAPVRNNADGEDIRLKNPGSLSTTKCKAERFSMGATLFTDRIYTVAENLATLKVTSFLRVPLDGRKTVTCARAGTVWFLTPKSDRNKASCSVELIEQGFKMVRMPEVRLFNPVSTANFCTLDQKDCEQRETISVGKWAVPLMLP